MSGPISKGLYAPWIADGDVPAPWSVEDSDTRTVVRDAAGGFVAECTNGFHDDEGDWIMSSACGPIAKLIAAAPELLAALQAIATALDAPRNRFGRLETTFAQGNELRDLRVLYDTPGCRDNVDGSVLVARAAIAKATGSAA